MLEEGDIVEISEGHTVNARVPSRLIYSNKKNSVDMTNSAVNPIGELSYLKGRYVVYKTCIDGGSHGGGMTGYDTFPDGHHVFCEKLDDRNVRVDFFQSGCFTASIPDIKPVGYAVRQWLEIA